MKMERINYPSICGLAINSHPRTRRIVLFSGFLTLELVKI